MASIAAPAIQDFYLDAFAHCFGCGKLNPQGHHLKSRLVDGEVVAEFTAPDKYTGGFPGKTYGGLVASLIDCHGTASAAAFAARADGTEIGGDKPLSRFVTASLKVDFRNAVGHPIGHPWAAEVARRAKGLDRHDAQRRRDRLRDWRDAGDPFARLA